MAQAARPERIEIGFGGGQVIAARVVKSQLDELRKAMKKAEGWYQLATEDGAVDIDLRQVVFVRMASPEHRVGFHASS